jgi:hypothetical protein
MSTHTITIHKTTGAPTPQHQPCHKDHIIIWHNDSSRIVDSFQLPSCVTPQTDPSPIQPGACTLEYKVKGGITGSFPYRYVFESRAKVPIPQSGTIDPS